MSMSEFRKNTHRLLGSITDDQIESITNTVVSALNDDIPVTELKKYTVPGLRITIAKLNHSYSIQPAPEKKQNAAEMHTACMIMSVLIKLRYDDDNITVIFSPSKEKIYN